MFYTSIYLYIRLPINVSGLLISLWGPGNPIFVRNKYIALTGNRSYVGYVQQAEARTKIPYQKKPILMNSSTPQMLTSGLL